MALVTKKGFTKLYEVSGDIGSTLELSLDWDFVHAFAGVDFFGDSALTIPVEPTAGTVRLMGTTIVTQTPQYLVGGTIDAVNRKVVNFSSNMLKVTATPMGLVGPTHYRVRVSTNRS